MKTLQSILKAVLFTWMLGAVFHNVGYAQDSTKQKAIENKVVDKDFVFVAQTVLPQRGNSRQLTSYYDLRVSIDTLVSNLPYFGRAYSAPINPAEAGLSFTSTSFEYTTKDRKKGGWDILIKPKDKNDVQQLLLSVSQNGYASLQVISNNRQPISFYGTIAERKKNE